MIMKRLMTIILGIFLGVFSSCYDDKGNYDYHEIQDIKINNIPKLVEVLASVEQIKVTPEVVSSLKGVVEDGDADYEFSYRLEKKNGGTIVPNKHWVDITQEGSKNLDIPADFKEDYYICWFQVKDVHTGVATFATFDVKVTSTTYEGYMVLCNEGPANRVRLDMISRLSADRIVPAYDLMSTRGLPALTRTSCIGFNPTRLYPFDRIWLLTYDGGYEIDSDTFESGEGYHMKYDFFDPGTAENLIAFDVLNVGGTINSGYLAVSDQGHAFFMDLSQAAGTWEHPMNSTEYGGIPEYRVAPYIGLSPVRKGNASTALFYDIDHKRFVGWTFSNASENARHILTPVSDPADAKFSFNTGMELVYMESTSYSGGLVYAVLKNDGGQYFIYGINMGGTGFTQESKYELGASATDFSQATQYAFHSQYPFMYYAVGNKVYSYNLGTGVSNVVLTLPDNEEVTMLKFNLYKYAVPTELIGYDAEFAARQYELMVGSYNPSEEKNGGTLGFYVVDGTNNTLTKRIDYTGFAKIKDVVYRERY